MIGVFTLHHMTEVSEHAAAPVRDTSGRIKGIFMLYIGFFFLFFLSFLY
jgi:hypothetical protein